MSNKQLREWFDDWCEKNNVGIKWMVGEDSPFYEYGFPGPITTENLLKSLSDKVENELWDELHKQYPDLRLVL